MRQVFLLLIAGVLQTSLSAQRQPPRDPGSASGGARISGVVTSRQGPVEGATVKILSSTWRQSTAMSDPEGQFRFSSLAEGLYTLTVEKEGYLPAEFGATRPAYLGGAGTQIALAANQQLTELTVSLTRGGIIAGTLTGADGLPAASTTVQLIVPGQSGIRDSTRTDSKGEYRFGGLGPGEYQVMAHVAAGHAPVLYPGVVDPRLATAVRVNVEEMRNGVDMALVLVAPGQVSGTIVDETGRPAAGIEVHALHSTASDQVRAKANTEGRFVFERIFPGSWRVTAARVVAADVAPGPDAARDLWAETTIDVSPGPAPDIVLRLRPKVVFAGRIELAGAQPGAPIDLSTCRVFLTKPGFHPGEVKVNHDGTFATTTAPGLKEVSAAAPDSSSGWWLRSAMWRGRDLLDHPPEFDEATGDLADVVLTFTNRHTELAGAVRSADDVPVHDAWVVIFPVDRTVWNDYSRRLTWTRPATNGRFVLRDVPAGEYHVAAVRDFDRLTWKSHEFLTLLAAAGIRVRLQEGKPVTQELRLMR